MSNILKIFWIIAILIIVLTVAINIHKTNLYSNRMSTVCIMCGKEIEEITIKADILGNGIYTYNILNIPDIEVHGACNIFDNETSFICDGLDRIHKYYFEQWEDEEKDKFIINEEYKDAKYHFTTEENWILKYETYLEVESYEELMEATEIIIGYIDYFGTDIYLGNKIYIKFQDSIIVPQLGSGQSGETIRKNVEQIYNNLLKQNV